MTDVRMREVADRAGVSTKTVSRVLVEPHRVAPATAARVRSAMSELGYLGNEVASAFKRGRTRAIGMLVPLLTMPFWSEVAAGAESGAYAHGYSLLLCDTSSSVEKEEAYLSLLLSQRVAGLVYAEPRCRPDVHPACASLVRTDTPVVVISAAADDLPYPHVHGDDRRAGYVGVRHLCDLGRRRVAVVVSDALAAPYVERVAGARDALRDEGVAPENSPVYLAPPDAAGGYAAGASMLTNLSEGEQRPDGIFVTSDIMAFGLLDALREHDVRVPEDIAVVGHDGLPMGAASHPTLTTIAPPRAAMGRLCIDILLCRPDGAESLMTQVIDADFIVRASTIGDQAPRHGVRGPLSASKAWADWRRNAGAEPAASSLPVVRLSTFHDVLGV